jgi:hypothetical protein
MVGGEVEVHFRDPVLVTASWRDVFFEVWLGNGDGRYMRTVRRDHNLLMERHGKAAALTAIHLTNVKGMDDEMRREINLRVDDMRHRTIAHATLVLATGFAASILRSAITGVRLLQRVPYPNKTLDSIDAGCQWLAPYLAPPDRCVATAAQLRAIMESLDRGDPTGKFA